MAMTNERGRAAVGDERDEGGGAGDGCRVPGAGAGGGAWCKTCAALAMVLRVVGGAAVFFSYGFLRFS